jgi:hypothetical protein
MPLGDISQSRTLRSRARGPKVTGIIQTRELAERHQKRASLGIEDQLIIKCELIRCEKELSLF